MQEENIRQLRQHNQKAFQELVIENQSRILTMAYKFTNNYNDAEDLCQDIFIKIYQYLPDFKYQCKLSTWIYKIAMNTCLDWKRKSKRRFFDKLSFTDQKVKEVKDNACVEDIVVYKEKQQMVHLAVKSLKDKYKAVIILYHFNHLTYKEISYILDLPVKTIETRLYRARKQLKDKLIKEGYGGEAIEVQRV